MAYTARPERQAVWLLLHQAVADAPDVLAQ